MCIVKITFTPSAAGLRTAYLAISDNTAAQQHRVSLTGTGEVPPTLTPTPIPTHTAIPTSTRTPTATKTPITKHGYYVVIDTKFSKGGADNWVVSPQGSSPQITNGRLVLTAPPHMSVGASPSTNSMWRNAVITATVTLQGGGYVGVIGRESATGTDYYALVLTANGNFYNFYLERSQGGVQKPLTSGQVFSQADNTLSLRCQGNTITASINGGFVYSKIDPDPLPRGSWAVEVLGGQGPQGTTQGSFSRITLAAES